MDQGTGARANRIEFTGQGGEYFRIWIVNLALTIVTFGIYSAWAKVRRMQYFYRHTNLMGGSFDYHGNPRAILKGRLLGFGMLVAYNAASQLNPAVGLVALALLMVALPWMLRQSLGFRLTNSSYRGLRFRFHGTTKEAYRVFLLWPFLGYVTAGILFPLAYQRIKAYQHGNSAFGKSRFAFHAKPGQFYKLYFKALGMLVIPIALLAAIVAVVAATAGFSSVGRGFDPKVAQGIGFAVALVFYLGIFLVIGPWWAARTQNLFWNHTALGPHQLVSDASAKELFVLYLTNFIGILCTLGLFKPFADIRLARYRLSHMAVVMQTDLSKIERDETSGESATGEEMADLFDVDLSF